MELEELRDKLLQHLGAHEKSSQWRYEELSKQIHGLESTAQGPKEIEMSEGINTDKVIVNAGGGHDQGLGTMAAIAALGNRNDDSNSWAPAMAMLNNRRDDGFGGMNGILGIAALGLIFGRGRGGLFGGGDSDGGGGESRLQNNADTLAILATAGNVKDAATSGFATSALAMSEGFAGVKDSVQNLALFQTQQLNNINQNISEQGCRTREVVQAGNTAILSALAADRISELQAQLCRLENHGRARETEISVNQTVNQQQAQWQSQRFDDERFNRLAAFIGNQTLNARQGQDVINFGGTMTGSGTQASANNQVR